MKEFIDEFKHLEKLCNEIYADQHGVTLYINEMTQKPIFSTRGIAGWDSDLEKLKRVRYIRNKLVHEPDCYVDYSESDIVFIREFYNRILNQQDPLALLRKQNEPVKKVEPQSFSNDMAYHQQNYQEYGNDGNADRKRESDEDGKLSKGLLIATIIGFLIGLSLVVIIAIKFVIV